MSYNSVLTADHPDVVNYISRASALLARAEIEVHKLEHFSGCRDLRWHDLSQGTTWWRVEYGGVARPEGVANALGKSGEMSLDEARCVFAVAALAVYNRPAHPAHWAFWARNSKRRVAQLVHELVCEQPARIALPPNVAWIDLDYNMIGLGAYQKGWLPQAPRPPGEHVPSTIAKKAICRGTRTSARQAAAHGRVAQREVVDVGAETNANGKRVAPMEETTIDVEVPAAKRVKRRATVGGSIATEPQAVASRPKAGGRKVGRTSTTQALCSVADAPVKTAAIKKTRSKTNAARKTAKTQPSPPTIHIIPPQEVDVVVDVVMDENAQEPTQPVAGPSAPTGKNGKAPLKAYRTPPNAAKAIFSSSPLTEPPATPEQDSSPAPRKPGTRKARRRAFSAALSDTSEQSAALSATTTLVQGADSSDEASTRAATPRDLDEKTADGKNTSRLSPYTPVRSSARIRSKRTSISPATSDDVPLSKRRAQKRVV